METNLATATIEKPSALHCQCHCEYCQLGLPEVEEPASPRGNPEPINKDPLGKEVDTFESRTAVDVIRNGDKFHYKIAYNGKDEILTSSEATPAGMEQAEKKIAALVVEKQKYLEDTFKVTFSKAGDDVIKQWVQKPDCTSVQEEMIKARAPKLIELCGIQACLTRCVPSDVTAKGEGVKFHFLEANMHKASPVLAYFVYGDKDGKHAVYFEPGSNKNKPATEVDADRSGKDKLRSIEALTTHELSHNHQAKNGLHTPAEKEKLSKSIGWLPVVSKDGSTEWMMEGKGEGEFYRYGKDTCSDNKAWVKCDKEGSPLNKDGVKSTFKDAKNYKWQEIQTLAKIKPISYYFPNSTEMFAEGLMMLRLGGNRMQELYVESPQLYKVAKEQDQIEIDNRFGKTDNGESKMMRGVDGLLKANDKQNQALRAEFENKYKKS